MCVKDVRSEPKYINTEMVEQMIYGFIDEAVEKYVEEHANDKNILED